MLTVILKMFEPRQGRSQAVMAFTFRNVFAEWHELDIRIGIGPLMRRRCGTAPAGAQLGEGGVPPAWRPVLTWDAPAGARKD